MKKVFSGALAAMMIMATVPSVCALEVREFYVDVNAQAGGDGSVSNPFKTVEEARDAIRALKKNNEYPKDGVTVYIREGQYSLASSVFLKAKTADMKEHL